MWQTQCTHDQDLSLRCYLYLGRGSDYVYSWRRHRRARTVSERRRGVAAAAGEASDCAAGDLQHRPPSTFPSSTSFCPQGRLACDPLPHTSRSASLPCESSCTSSHAGNISLDLTRNGFEYNASLFPSDLSRRPCRASATSFA